MTTRYKNSSDSCLYPDDAGDWISYEDHRKELSRQALDHIFNEDHWIETQAKLEKKIEVLSAEWQERASGHLQAHDKLAATIIEALEERDAARAEVERYRTLNNVNLKTCEMHAVLRAEGLAAALRRIRDCDYSDDATEVRECARAALEKYSLTGDK
jgi:hypothetical protein